MQNYQTIDGKTIVVDKSKKFRMPHIDRGEISYPEIGNLDGFISVFQEETVRGHTVEMAKAVMQQFEKYLNTRDEDKSGKALFIVAHSTSLFAPSDGSKADPAKLGETYDELMNTYRILEQMVEI